VRVEGRDQHERVADVVLNSLPVWLHALDTELPERPASVCKNEESEARLDTTPGPLKKEDGYGGKQHPLHGRRIVELGAPQPST
jgi:hypothetical protein